MKRAIVSVVMGVVASTLLMAGPAAAGGGNSDNAKLCQHGRWAYLYREDGTPFKNQGDCVSYAAQGGVLPYPVTRAICKQLGGQFDVGDGAPLNFRCDTLIRFTDPQWDELVVECAASVPGLQMIDEYFVDDVWIYACLNR